MKTVDIQEAKELLLKGEVVAFPTETVYGLGGWIYSEVGLRKIFSSKERPFFDPLIVHIESIEKAKKLTTDWTETHQALAEACWPGPLTLIAKKHDSINPLITSGLDSVGLRCPKHDLTLKLLATIDGGLAGPSANKFGKTSPTSAQHVSDEFGDVVPVLDGGPCEVGIESTVAGIERIDQGFKVLIYRPGHFTSAHLQNVLVSKGITAEVVYAQSPVAPGQLKHHYMPNIPLVIVPSTFDWNKDKTQVEAELKTTFNNPALWKLAEHPAQASRELYQDLRRFSGLGHDIIVLRRDPAHTSDDWRGIWNRLEKAKTIELGLK